MRRRALEDLEEWFKKRKKRPLIVRGARQVGKTWILQEFGQTVAENYVYVNFEDDKALRNVFETDFDIERILSRISLYKNININENTLIILDEIQEAPHGITSLKYFAEKKPNQYVVAAGSLLGIALHRNDSFPVGKVEFMNVYPMDFEEFLWATNNKSLADAINKQDWELLTTVKEKLEQLLRTYYFVGGMPKVVDTYINTGDLSLAREEQNALLTAYDNDFSKHAPHSIVPKIRLVWESIVAQLSKENKKFVFGLVKSGARAREYELALEWLYDAGLLTRVNRCKNGELPLKAYIDISAFKIFMLDIGLLCAMAEVSPRAVVEPEQKLLGGFKGGLTEQFVFQQIKTVKGIGIYYWSAENSSGELDFLLQKDDTIIPVEVKAEENLQSKSLGSFCNKYGLKSAVRFSMSNYKEQEWMRSVPLYGVRGCFV